MSRDKIKVHDVVIANGHLPKAGHLRLVPATGCPAVDSKLGDQMAQWLYSNATAGFSRGLSEGIRRRLEGKT